MLRFACCLWVRLLIDGWLFVFICCGIVVWLLYFVLVVFFWLLWLDTLVVCGKFRTYCCIAISLRLLGCVDWWWVLCCFGLIGGLYFGLFEFDLFGCDVFGWFVCFIGCLCVWGGAWLLYCVVELFRCLIYLLFKIYCWLNCFTLAYLLVGVFDYIVRVLTVFGLCWWV